MRTRRRLSRTFSAARWTEYRRLLEHALASGYRVVSLEDWLVETEAGTDPAPVLVLRHDVDQHPAAVRRMLEIEDRLGLASTWYFRWRTADARIIEAVRRQGGAVGFHYETLTRRLLRNPGELVDAQVLERCRDELGAEIETFGKFFGPIRSVCPHGDSRVPGVSNQILLAGVDPARFGVEFDGNAAMGHRGLAMWLTDRNAPDGYWKDGVDPLDLLSRRESPVLCLTHPNNFVSGLGLWADRLVAAVLPTPMHGRVHRIVRTGADEPPSRRGVQPGGCAFGPVAESLRRAVRDYYEERGVPLSGAAGQATLMTNSDLVEQRTETLLDVLFRHSTLSSARGLRVLDAGCGFGAVALALACRGASVMAVDPNDERYAVGATVAERFELDIDFRRGYMQTTKLPATSFDLVIANNSFCYLVEPQARRSALERLYESLRPGGWLIMRNPNRLFPRDQFTGLPLVGLLAPATASRVASRFHRPRSQVRLAFPWEIRGELRRVGFEDVAVAGARTGALQRHAGAFARYQHALGRRRLESAAADSAQRGRGG